MQARLHPATEAALGVRWGPGLVAGAAAAGCAVLWLVDPNRPGAYPTCPFLALTGKWCPGCGTLRGLRALLGGDVAAAVGFNVLMVAALPYLVYRWVLWAWPALASRLRSSRPTGALPVYALLAVVVVFWVARNIPAAPFTALAP